MYICTLYINAASRRILHTHSHTYIHACAHTNWLTYTTTVILAQKPKRYSSLHTHSEPMLFTYFFALALTLSAAAALPSQCTSSTARNLSARNDFFPPCFVLTNTHTLTQTCCCWTRVEEFARALSSFPFPVAVALCSWHTHTTEQQD